MKLGFASLYSAALILAICGAQGVTLAVAEERSGEHAQREGRRERGTEETGTELKLGDRYDQTRYGVRLVLAYDKSSNSFRGTIKNVTKRPLERVRVEIHLSNGKELGPTRPVILKPGQEKQVRLIAKGKGFTAWSTHAEVGNEEHGERGEHGGREGRGEHGGREGRGERSSREGRGEHGGREGRGEHSADRGGDGEGEEDGTELRRSATYDEVRNGARLILKYDEERQAFRGVVQNISKKPLERVRVEIHLSKRSEIGPTKPVNLKPGQKQNVLLVPETKDFHKWSTHAEVGNEEHQHGESGEHAGRERGEHSGREGRGERSSREGRGEHNGREKTEQRRAFR